MALAFIVELEEQGYSGGWIGRVIASLRKLDIACRKAGIFPPDVPMLLPYKDQGGPGGFHSTSKPIPYTPEQALAIIDWITEREPAIARLLKLMWRTGLRVTEASYLRVQDIDLEKREVRLNQDDNANRTKGGRPRIVQYSKDHQEFMAGLKHAPDVQPTGHLFASRRGLPDNAREKVRQACRALDIECLGTHAFRKAFSVDQYRRERKFGATDRQALLRTARQLGHTRVDVTRQSYVPPQDREQSNESQPNGEM